MAYSDTWRWYVGIHDLWWGLRQRSVILAISLLWERALATERSLLGSSLRH